MDKQQTNKIVLVIFIVFIILMMISFTRRKSTCYTNGNDDICKCGYAKCRCHHRSRVNFEKSRFFIIGTD
jgi:hypothetical protein